MSLRWSDDREIKEFSEVKEITLNSLNSLNSLSSRRDDPITNSSFLIPHYTLLHPRILAIHRRCATLFEKKYYFRRAKSQ